MGDTVILPVLSPPVTLLSHCPHSSTHLQCLGGNSCDDLQLTHRGGTQKVISIWPCPTRRKNFAWEWHQIRTRNMTDGFYCQIMCPGPYLEPNTCVLMCKINTSAGFNGTAQLLKTTSCRFFSKSLVHECFKIFAEYFKRR